MAASTQSEPRSLYAVAAIRLFGKSEYFCGLRKIGQGETIAAPHALSIDQTTEAAIHRATAAHFARLRQSSLPADTPELMGVITGGRRSAQLFQASESGEWIPLREIDATMLYVEIAGANSHDSGNPPVHEDVFVYKPAMEPEAVKPRSRWRFWQRA